MGKKHDSQYANFGWLRFFVSLGIPPKIRFDGQNRGNPPTKIWLRYKIFRIFTLPWVLQNLIFWKNIARVLMRVNWAGFIQCFLLKLWQKTWGCLKIVGRRNIFSPSAKIAIMVLKAYTGLSDRHLVEHLNGNLHYCGFFSEYIRQMPY